MTHGSLFSGIGGFDLAAEWCGWENAFHCEWAEFPRRVLQYHFPNAISYDNICTTDFTPWRGRIDVLSGGFPCQPFSSAGKRQGAHDDRYLWPEMLRVIDEIRPRWVVGENVAGILSMVQPYSVARVESQTSLFDEDEAEIITEQAEFVLETICRDFECLGYSVQPLVIPACAVGAPHRRDRVWFIAHRADAGTQGVPRGADSLLPTGSTANASEVGGCGRSSDSPWAQKDEAKWADLQRTAARPSHIGVTANAKCDGLQRRDGCNIGQASQEHSPQKLHRPANDNPWQGFPTQPPVCGGDDGLPRGLDAITFPRWRTESVKAYGNAVVPQVALEIFKSINELEQK